MKMVSFMKRTKMCEYCIAGDTSHGLEIFVGNLTNGKCEECGSTEDVYNVIYQSFKEEK